MPLGLISMLLISLFEALFILPCHLAHARLPESTADVPRFQRSVQAAISGFIDENEVKDLKEHGFDDYLKKPFSAQDLQARVKALFELPSSKATRPRRLRTLR